LQHHLWGQSEPEDDYVTGLDRWLHIYRI